MVDTNNIITQALAAELRAVLPAEKIRCNGCIGKILVLKRQISVRVMCTTVRLQLRLVEVLSSEFDLAYPDSIEVILTEACWLVAFQRHLSYMLYHEMNDRKVNKLLAWAKLGHHDYEWPC